MSKAVRRKKNITLSMVTQQQCCSQQELYNNNTRAMEQEGDSIPSSSTNKTNRTDINLITEHNHHKESVVCTPTSHQQAFSPPHHRESISGDFGFSCPFSSESISDPSSTGRHFSIASSSVSSSSSSSNMDDDETTSFATSQLDSLLRKHHLLAEIQQSTQTLERISMNRKACAIDLEFKDELKINRRHSGKCSFKSNHSPNSPESDGHASRSHDLLRSIYNAQLSAALHMENPSKLFLDLLNEVISLIRCQYSFIGEVKYTDDGKPFLHSHAISFARTKLSQEALDLFQKCTQVGFKFNNMNSLFGHVMMTGQPLLTNHPKTHPFASPNHVPPGMFKYWLIESIDYIF